MGGGSDGYLVRYYRCSPVNNKVYLHTGDEEVRNETDISPDPQRQWGRVPVQWGRVPVQYLEVVYKFIGHGVGGLYDHCRYMLEGEVVGQRWVELNEVKGSSRGQRGRRGRGQSGEEGQVAEGGGGVGGQRHTV